VNDDYSITITTRYSEAIPTKAVIQRLAALGPIIEVGAGGGYWARLIRDVDGDVIATDVEAPETNGWYPDLAPWTHVQQADAVEAVTQHENRVIEGYQKVPILFNLPRRASHRNNDRSRRMW